MIFLFIVQLSKHRELLYLLKPDVFFFSSKNKGFTSNLFLLLSCTSLIHCLIAYLYWIVCLK